MPPSNRKGKRAAKSIAAKAEQPKNLSGNEECCSNCSFSRTDPHDPAVVNCLRYPPSQIDEGMWKSPRMLRRGWCGEWKPKSKEQLN